MDDGGPPVTSYRLTYLKEVARASQKSRVVYRPARGAKPVTRTIPGKPATVSGLSTRAVFYVFKVAARNASGRSPATPYSRPITLRTGIQASARVSNAAVLGVLQSDVNGALTWQGRSPGGRVCIRGTLHGRSEGLIRRRFPKCFIP